jgi:hypothetical protein
MERTGKRGKVLSETLGPLNDMIEIEERNYRETGAGAPTLRVPGKMRAWFPAF